MTPQPESHVRLYRFHDRIAISFPSTQTIYLEKIDAWALAKELRMFVAKMETDKWPCTRVIKNGVATNESDGKKKPYVLP